MKIKTADYAQVVGVCSSAIPYNHACNILILNARAVDARVPFYKAHNAKATCCKNPFEDRYKILGRLFFTLSI